MNFNDIMDFHKENKDNFELLKKDYEEGLIVPFIGAGLSIPPYSGWGDALRNIYSIIDDAKDVLEDLLNRNEFELAAQYVYDRLGTKRFNKAFNREFSLEKIVDTGLSKAMLLLPNLFNGPIFTTNYDHCIEEAYGNDFRQVVQLKNNGSDLSVVGQTFRDQPHFLFKLHGDIVSGRILLKTEYDELYAEGGWFEKILENLFAFKKFLFLGCSLTGTDRYMNSIDRTSGYSADNYAILPMLDKKKSESNEEYKTRQEKWETLLSNYNISPIFYPAGDYSSVVEILEALKHNFEINSIWENPTGFIGRDDEIQKIEDQLNKYRYVFVHGEGGIGKTQVCERIVSRFFGESIRVYLQGSTGYASLINAVAKAVGINCINKKIENLISEINLVVANLSSKKPLLIYLDNFEDVMACNMGTTIDEENNNQPDPAVNWIINIINNSPSSLKVLISTRDHIPGPTSYELPILGEPEMTMLFQNEFNRAGGESLRLKIENNAIAKLVKEVLGGLPLAAVLAASQAVISGSIEKTYNQWKLGKTFVQGVAPNGNNRHIALKTAFLVSYKHLLDNTPAKKLWGYLALVPKGISPVLGVHLLEDEFDDASKSLRQLSLARVDFSNNLYMLTPIKQQIFAYNIEIEKECVEDLKKYYCSILKYQTDNNSCWLIAVDSVDDIVYFLDYQLSNCDKFGSSLKELWDDDYDLLYLSGWRPLSFWEIYDKMISDKDFYDSCSQKLQAKIYLGRGKAHYLLGYEEEALNDYNIAKDIYKDLKDFDKIAIINTYIADVEINLFNDARAKELYEQALRHFEYIKDLRNIGICKTEIGDLLYRNEDSSKGLELMEEGYNLLKSDKENRQALANSSWMIGRAYRRIGNLDMAKKYLKEAEAVYLIEKDDLGLGNVYKDYAEIYEIEGPSSKSKEYLKKALHYFKRAQVEEKYYNDVQRKIDTISESSDLMLSVEQNIESHNRDYNILLEEIIRKIDKKIAELEDEERND